MVITCTLRSITSDISQIDVNKINDITKTEIITLSGVTDNIQDQLSSLESRKTDFEQSQSNFKTSVATAIKKKNSNCTITKDSDLTTFVNGIEAIVTGLELTKDATALAGDIVASKTAYVNGKKLTGTIVNIPDGRSWTKNGVDGIVLLDTTNVLNYQGNKVNAGTCLAFENLGSDVVLRTGSYFSAKQADVASAIGLTAGKVMKGNTVLGVAGTATSDGTATAGDIANGKTAYVNGSKITGSVKVVDANYSNGVLSGMGTMHVYGKYQYSAGGNISIIPVTEDNYLIRKGNTSGTKYGIAVKQSELMDKVVNDTTATAADVLSGKTFYTKDGLKTGTRSTGTNAGVSHYRYVKNDLLGMMGSSTSLITHSDTTWTKLCTTTATEKLSIPYNLASCPANVLQSATRIYILITLNAPCPSDTSNGGWRRSAGYASGTTTAQYIYMSTQNITASVSISRTATGAISGSLMNVSSDTHNSANTVTHKSYSWTMWCDELISLKSGSSIPSTGTIDVYRECKRYTSSSTDKLGDVLTMYGIPEKIGVYLEMILI